MQVSLDNGVGKSRNKFLTEIMPHPVKIFPHELIYEIFTHFNLATLGTVCCVNNAWQQLGNKPNLWKIAIYKEIAFGNDKWAQCFGSDIVKDEVSGEDFDSLPFRDFISDVQKFKRIFPEKNAKDILMLVRLPKTLNGGLTLKNLGQLAKKYFPNSNEGYAYIWEDIIKEKGDNLIDKSRWVLMTKDVLPGSRNKSFDDQQKLVADLAKKFLVNYQVPELLESTACILSQYFSSYKRLFNDIPSTYTRCMDNIQGYRLVVGGFSPNGLDIVCHIRAHSEIGIAALRKF